MCKLYRYITMKFKWNHLTAYKHFVPVFYIFISFPTLIALGAREEDGFCVSMSANHPVGLWSTFNCTTLSSFICEFPRVGFTTPTTAPPTTTLPKSCETGWLELDGNCYKVCAKLFNSTESTLHFNIEYVNLILKKNWLLVLPFKPQNKDILEA